MRKTTLLVLVFLAAVLFAFPSYGAGRKRIANLSFAVLSGRVVDFTSANPVIGVEVEGTSFFARTDSSGKFTLMLPVTVPVTLTFRRTGYEPHTETVVVTAASDRTFRVRARPTARIITTDGVTHVVDSDSVEFGWAVPFSGYRRDRTARMCRSGAPEFTLDRNEIARVEGPAITSTETACCTTPVTGALFNLKNGERTTAFFSESCRGAVMEVIARDHVTWELVFVPLTRLRELVLE